MQVFVLSSGAAAALWHYSLFLGEIQPPRSVPGPGGESKKAYENRENRVAAERKICYDNQVKRCVLREVE